MAGGVELGTGQRVEVDVVEADVADVAVLGAVLAPPLVHQVDERVADALDRGDVELARASLAGVAPGAQ
jgi:positive regulator of sigma E activity